jgi:glycosyltransferase involved in cell wall biosynthesis
MENRLFFSIVIPNYKTEQFLEQCLKSVIKQEFTDYECILLDDGSPGMEVGITEGKVNYWYREEFKNEFVPSKTLPLKDQVNYIFEKTVGNDPRFKFISHQNMGQGPTRQKGIESAKGVRVVFLDCDDFLDSKYLQSAYNHISEIESYQICFAEIENYQNGKKLPFSFNQKYIPAVNNLSSMLTFPTWSLGPINYFWRIDILRKHGVKYIGGRGEDTKFFLNCIFAYFKEYGKKSLQDFHKIPKPGYNYRLFEYQNYRVPNFEQELFLELTNFVKSISPNLYQMGFKYYVLGHLYWIRFRLYRLKLNANNIVYRGSVNILAKVFTLFSIIISKTKKENV